MQKIFGNGLKNIKTQLNWFKYELKSLVPEPEWVNEIVSNYTTVRHGQKFTPDELARIKFLYAEEKHIRR